MDPVIIGATSETHKRQLKELAKFAGAETIEYRNLDAGENYILTKEGKTIVLRARSNRFNGGFMCIDYDQPVKSRS